MSFTKHFDYLYVEATSYCNLKCPRCPRTYEKGNYPLKHLAVETFEDFLKSGEWSDVRTVEFGGNLGDPLMHPQINRLIELVHEIRPNAHVLIHTSGSQPQKVWQKVLRTLKSSDSVLLSVDGLEDTNHLYRVGANWAWVEEALRTCPQFVHTTWKFIVFKHNQHQVFDALERGKSFEVQSFLLTKSHVFDGQWADASGIDPMAPAPQWKATAQETIDRLTPRCQTSSMHYLSASGEYSPCCWTEPYQEMRYPLERFSTFTKLMDDPKLNSLPGQWIQNEPEICGRKCATPKLSRSAYTQLTLDLSLPILELQQRTSAFEAGS